jgi:hypothetical protein
VVERCPAPWSGHVARIREGVEGKKAEMDAKQARRRVDAAVDDTVVAFAEAALEEADHAAVRNATLARRDAETAAK